MKGILFLSRLAFLREQGGSAVEQVLAKLGPADAAVLRSSIKPDAWYPLEVQHRVDDAIASIFAQYDRADVLIQIGRASANAVLAGSDGRYIKHGAPAFFLNVVPRLYSSHHSVGRREYRQLSANAGVIRTIEAEQAATRDECWTVIGWLQRGLELSGAEAVLVAETRCHRVRAPHCEYLCEWRELPSRPH